MPSVWEHRFAELVKRLGGLRESTQLELLPDLMPVLPVMDPEQPETRLPRGEVLISATYDITSAAAQFPTWWLENPAGSNLLVVVERFVICSPSVATEVRWGSGANAAPGAPVPTATDDERRPNTATRSRRVTESAAAAISGRQFFLQTGVTLVIPVRQVVPPGFSLQVQGQTALQRLAGYIQGYERAVTAGELASQ